MVAPLSKERGRGGVPPEGSSLATWEHRLLYLRRGSSRAAASDPALAPWLLCRLHRWSPRAGDLKRSFCLFLQGFECQPCSRLCAQASGDEHGAVLAGAIRKPGRWRRGKSYPSNSSMPFGFCINLGLEPLSTTEF